jgi:GR25 family glycosyltransferase involved in LPS biosynthesis
MYLYLIIILTICLVIGILFLIYKILEYYYDNTIIPTYTCEEKINEIVSSQNSTMMNIYYINLEKSKDRNERFLNDISDNNFNPFRIDAVSPETLPEIKKSSNYKNSFLKKTEDACMASHFKAIHTAYHNNEEYALICEDDAILDNIDYRKLISTAPDDWEILQLHFFGTIYFTNKRIQHLYNSRNVLWISTKNNLLSCGCYIINHKAMYRILSQFVVGFENPNWNEIIALDYTSFNSICVADFLLYKFLNRYVCIYPFVNIYESHKSTIDSSHDFFNSIFFYIKTLFTNNDVLIYYKNYNLKKNYNTYFITYSNYVYKFAKMRLCKEVLNSNMFNYIFGYSPKDIYEYEKKLKPYIDNKRGGGYWLWKPIILKKTFDKMKENDILVYCDAGCTFNNDEKAIQILKEYFSILENTNTPIIRFELSHKENLYTSDAIFDYFKITKENPIFSSNQLNSTVFLIRKRKETIEMINEYFNIAITSPNIFSDEFNETTKKNRSEFIDNRHDQSVFSVLGKLYKNYIYILPDETYNQSNMPFNATRKKF